MGAPGGHDRVQCVPTSRGGLEASTRYRVLLGTRSDSEARVSLVALWPENGRTHQLRVHCAERLGAGENGRGSAGACYILGDTKYGPRRHDQSVLSGARGLREVLDDESGEVGVTKRGSGSFQVQNEHRQGLAASRSHGVIAESSEKVRLCLHALCIKLRAGRLDGGRGTATRPLRHEARHVAQVPEHFIFTAEQCGMSRRAVTEALTDLMREIAGE